MKILVNYKKFETILLKFEVLLKNSSYIFSEESVNKNQDILTKIHIQTENELKSQFCYIIK